MSDSPYVIDLKPPPGFWTPPAWRAEYWRTAPVLRPLKEVETDGGSHQSDGTERHQAESMGRRPRAEQQYQERAAGPRVATMLPTADGYVLLFGKPVMLPARLRRRQ